MKSFTTECFYYITNLSGTKCLVIESRREVNEIIDKEGRRSIIDNNWILFEQIN